MIDKHRHLAWPTYLVAFALCVMPPFDALMQVLPPHPGDPRWRFGFFGLMSNALMLPLLGLLLAFIAAAVFDHRLIQKTLGGIAALIAIATVGALLLFALDALQVHSQVQPTAILAFNVACLTAAAKALLGIVALSTFGYAGLKGPRLKRGAKERTAGVVIGSNSSAMKSRTGGTPASSTAMPTATSTDISRT